MQLLSGSWAQACLDEGLCPHLAKAMELDSCESEAIQAGFEDPYLCLRAFMGHYAFARRGKDRELIAGYCYQALERAGGLEGFDALLRAPEGVALWQAYDQVCVENRRKNNEPQNRGIIQGMLELAQEIYSDDGVGSIARWIVRGVKTDGKVEPQFERIVDIRGVGPKCASTFLRDVVLFYGVEELVDPADRLFIQPVDRWLRASAALMVPEPDMDKAADWIIAGKIGKYTRRARISGVLFNLGNTWYGTQTVKDVGHYAEAIGKLVAGEEFSAPPMPVSATLDEAHPE